MVEIKEQLNKPVILSPKGASQDVAIEGVVRKGPQACTGDPSVASLPQDDKKNSLPHDEKSLESDLSELKKEQDKVRQLTDELSERLHGHPESSHRFAPQDDKKNSLPQDDAVDKQNYSNILERFAQDSEFRNIFISGVNAAFHTAATATNFLAKDSESYKALNEIVDKAALFCTKIGAPLMSYSWSVVQAFKKKDPFLLFIKMIPAAFLPIIGDANIDTVYGASLGFNQPYDLCVERIEEKMKKDPEYQQEVHKAKTSFAGKGKLVWDTFKQMCKEFVKGKLPYHEAIYFVNCSMLLVGSLPMILFNRKARDTLPARCLGVIRSLGGILGDVGFMTTKTDFKKLLIGGMCSISAVAAITKRFVKSNLIAKTLIHLGAGLDVAAVSLWNAFNDSSGAKKAKEFSFA